MRKPCMDSCWCFIPKKSGFVRGRLCGTQTADCLLTRLNVHVHAIYFNMQESVVQLGGVSNLRRIPITLPGANCTGDEARLTECSGIGLDSPTEPCGLRNIVSLSCFSNMTGVDSLNTWPLC